MFPLRRFWRRHFGGRYCSDVIVRDATRLLGNLAPPMKYTTIHSLRCTQSVRSHPRRLHRSLRQAPPSSHFAPATSSQRRARPP